MIKFYLSFVIALFSGFIICSCRDSDGTNDNDGDYEIDIQDQDSDGMPDNSSVENADSDNSGSSCDTRLEMIVRDFNESHPDFEREDLGWGPAVGILETALGTDSKPVFRQTLGDYQIVQDEAQKAAYTFTVNNWVNSSEPMFDGAESFYDWYRDSDRNTRFEKVLVLSELSSSPGTYYFDSEEEPYKNFFPLSPSEGFGPGPEDDSVNPMHQNFLFTTEIHVTFEYVEGQVFRFSGDDDLWIFVNGKLALDLGGLHSQFNASIDFDAQASELGIVPGSSYNMDIFHAERHTEESNFRIETNISCFTPALIV